MHIQTNAQNHPASLSDSKYLLQLLNHTANVVLTGTVAGATELLMVHQFFYLQSEHNHCSHQLLVI